jgi:hypothetical protein
MSSCKFTPVRKPFKSLTTKFLKEDLKESQQSQMSMNSKNISKRGSSQSDNHEQGLQESISRLFKRHNSANTFTRRYGSVDDVIKNINTTEGFLKDPCTIGRVENGFEYLKNLVGNLKQSSPEDYSLDGVMRILCLKENVDYDAQKSFIRSILLLNF